MCDYGVCAEEKEKQGEQGHRASKVDLIKQTYSWMVAPTKKKQTIFAVNRMIHRALMWFSVSFYVGFTSHGVPLPYQILLILWFLMFSKQKMPLLNGE